MLISNLILSGCAIISEPFKVLWGSSTRALENARDEAMTKTYHCDFDTCYDAVLEIVRGASFQSVAKPEKSEESNESNQSSRTPSSLSTAQAGSQNTLNTVSLNSQYTIFINDRLKKHIVVMGIPGNVDTTEVGIFFAATASSGISKIDISSLSSTAKEKVAHVIFDGLDKKIADRR